MAGENRIGIIAELSTGAEVPTEFQLLPYGKVEIEGSEPFVVDEASMNGAISRFQARGLDMVIDYEHQTLGNEYSSPDGKAPAAGWIKALESRGRDGLWAKVAWTAKARELLAAREYRYYSPVFTVTKGIRKLIEVLQVALTNSPRLNWIRPIVAKHDPSDKEAAGMELLVLIAKKLGLPETATEAEVMAALEKSKTQPQETVACKEVLDALGLQEAAQKSEIVATIHALNALKQRPDLSQEIAALKAKLAGRERDELVAAAMKDGKITPAQKEWAAKYAEQDPEGFRLFVAKAPQVVPVKPMPAAKDPKGGAPDEAQLEINKLMGISEETWNKYNPAQA